MTGWPWSRHPRSSFQRRFEAVTRNFVTADIAAFHEDLASLEDLDIAGLDAGLQDASVSTPGLAVVDDSALDQLAQRSWSPLAAPIIYLIFGILPVTSISTEFFIRLIPFLLDNQLLFAVVGKGVKTWRGQQYSLALFPTWIRSITSAFGNVYLGRSLDFAVRPKTRQQDDTFRWDFVKPQLWAMGLLVAAALIGVIRTIGGQADILGTSVNILWVIFDLVIFSVIFQAVRYRGYEHYRADIA